MKRSYIYKRREIRKEELLKARQAYKTVTFVCTKKDEGSFDFMWKVAKPLWLDKRFLTEDIIEYQAVVDKFGAAVISNWYE